MASTDISPVVDRLKNRIESVTSIGLVHSFDIYAHDDLRPLIVTGTGSSAVMRAWWITGPTLSSKQAVPGPGGELERRWQYRIHGIEGLTASGDSIESIRSNALAVCDAIDLDLTLNDTCHRSESCAWPVRPENRTMVGGFAVSYIEITKDVVTLSTP